MPGTSNFFYEGAKCVKGFIKAKLNIPRKKEGEKPSPNFEDYNKYPKKGNK